MDVKGLRVDQHPFVDKIQLSVVNLPLVCVENRKTPLKKEPHPWNPTSAIESDKKT